jgi:hypothetical protein
MERVEQIAIQQPRQQSWLLCGAGLSIGVLLWGLLLWGLGSSTIVTWGARSGPQLSALLLIAITLYLLPGLALLRLCWPDAEFSWAEELTLACGISIALPPLLFQAVQFVGLPWNRGMTLLYVAVAYLVPVLAWGFQHGNGRRPCAVGVWHTCLLLGSIGVALLARLYVIRDLPTGMWGDSYHHTMIAQLLVDNEGLFSSWEPYAPLATFTYHYGFHANAALFHWLSGISIPKSVLYVGQFVNVASLASAYVLTTRLSGNRHAGLWAVLLTGFVNTLPAYYVNWGRYTQLTGQVILPAVVICWIAVLETKDLRWRRIVLAALVTAGLMLTHYIVTIFAVLFLGAYLVLLLVRCPPRPQVTALVGRSMAITSLSLVAAVPWLLNTLSGYLVRNVQGFVSQKVGADRIAGGTTLPQIPPFYLEGVILLLAAIGLVIALARRAWRLALLAGWSMLLILVVVPYLFGLPGTGVITWFTAYIALYITIIPLAAYTLGVGQELIVAWRSRFGYLIAAAGVVAVSVWGLRWQQDLIEPKHQLFWPADAKAMDWIMHHTPPDVLFLVNMFPAYGDSLFVGSDGGWWIPLLAKRQTTLPPLSYGSERSEPPEFSRHINAFAFALREHPLPSDEGIRLCREAGIQYIYSGARSQQRDKIDVEALRQHPAFEVVYEHEGVVIFALEPGAEDEH